MSRSHQLATRCADDPEFGLCARHWTGTLSFVIGDESVVLDLRAGIPSASDTNGRAAESPGHVTVSAPAELWSQILEPVPAPYFNDIVPAQAFGLRITGHRETTWQYYAAIRRAVDLLRLTTSGDPGDGSDDESEQGTR
jgi:hypothetical protein